MTSDHVLAASVRTDLAIGLTAWQIADNHGWTLEKLVGTLAAAVLKR